MNKEIHKRWMLFAIFVVVQEAAKIAAQLPPKSDFMVFCPRHKDVFRVNSAILQMTRTAAGIRNSTIFDFKKGETMLVVEAGKQAAALKIRNGSIVTVFQDTSTSGQSTDDIQVTYTAPDGSKNVGWLTLGEVDWPWCHTGQPSLSSSRSFTSSQKVCSTSRTDLFNWALAQGATIEGCDCL